MSRPNFNQIVFESVNEAISAVIDQLVTAELSRYLQAYIGVSVDEIPLHIDRLFSSLTNLFGTTGDDVCKMIVRKTYEKAGIPFYEIGGRLMIQYVEELKRMLAKPE